MREGVLSNVFQDMQEQMHHFIFSVTLLAQ
jgi:hypothetical protein